MIRSILLLYICTTSLRISFSIFTGSSHWWGELFYISVWDGKDGDWVLIREDSQLIKPYIHNAWCFSFKQDGRRKEKCGLNISFPFFSSLDREFNSLMLDCLLHELTWKPSRLCFCLGPQMLQVLRGKDVLFHIVLTWGFSHLPSWISF